ncbi:MAG: hypothetical protein NWF07_15835 [Candidatus Bathyarchaeota archaeon]|nr:hypothetical protein [Candidatus Bathyarchaeota archaeon]
MNKLRLTGNGRALTTVLFFRMLFGGYLIAMDQYRYSDPDSAWTVLAIYLMMGVFTSLYIYGKPIGLKLLIGLETVFILLNTVFIGIALGGFADVGMHGPLDNIWETALRYLFSVLTLFLSIRAYREPIPE